MLQLLRQAARASAGGSRCAFEAPHARFLHASLPARQGRRAASVNARTKKKIKVQVIPYGHIKPWIWAQEKLQERNKWLKAKYNLIKDRPVIHWTPPVLQAWITDNKNNKVGILPLNRKVWGTEIRKDVVHRVVRWQRAKWRQGTHKTKNRAEKRGGGRKPRQQKGSGRSRHGSIRSPSWVGGGKAHGKVPMNYTYKLNDRDVKLGLCSALSAKFKEGNLFVLQDSMMDTHKTEDLKTLMTEHWRPLLHNNIAVLHGKGELDNNFALAARVFWNFQFYDKTTINVYDVVKKPFLMATVQGIKEIEEKLLEPSRSQKKPIKYLVDMPIPKLKEATRISVYKKKRKPMVALRNERANRRRRELIKKFPLKTAKEGMRIDWKTNSDFVREFRKQEGPKGYPISEYPAARRKRIRMLTNPTYKEKRMMEQQKAAADAKADAEEAKPGLTES